MMMAKINPAAHSTIYHTLCCYNINMYLCTLDMHVCTMYVHLNVSMYVQCVYTMYIKVLISTLHHTLYTGCKL